MGANGANEGFSMHQRPKIVSWPAAAILACGALAAVQCAAADPIRIVAFGDSQTYGHSVSPSEAYPVKLEAALRAKGYQVSIANEGINGDTSAGALSRLDSAVPQGTAIAIVEFGLNDPRKGFSTATSRANLEAMVARLRDRGVQVLLYDATPTSELDVSSAIAARGALYYHQPPAAPGYRADTKSYHLNAAGYDWLVAQILPQVETLIQRVHP